MNMMQQSQPLLLIYLDFKGMAQVARHLLCFLDVFFIDVLLDRLEEQRKTLPACVFESLKGLKIDKSKLPVLIHEGVVIQELFPIMSYICYRFDREDLIGTDYCQKARVQELLQIYGSSLPHTQSILFELADTAAVVEEENLMEIVEAYYKKTLRESEYMRQLCDFIKLEEKHGFILGSITILDFYFVESSNYMLGLFGSLDHKIANENWREKSQQYGRKVRGIAYLKIMHDYQIMMKSLPYYTKHEQYLQSFKVVGSLTSPGRKKGFRRIWAIDMAQVM